MRLYYMTNLSTAINHILPEKRMRLAQFDRLNDPFELMCADIGNREERNIFKYVRDHFTKTLGVICMSTHWKSPLMWAHYAENHTGVCLGFDVPDDRPKQIVYEPERLKSLIDVAKPLRGITVEVLEKVVTTKYSQWAYEEEWRLFSSLDEPDPINGFYYILFGPELKLREIIVGARCKTPVGSFRKIVGEVEQSIAVIKARPAFESFSIVRQERVSPITIRPRR